MPRSGPTYRVSSPSGAGAPAQELEGTLVALSVFGFATLSAQLHARGDAGAEEFAELLSGTHEHLIEIGEGYGGDLLEFTGGSVLLFFSAGNHRRACEAASDIVLRSGDTEARISSVGPVTLQMSAGIYTRAPPLLPGGWDAAQARRNRLCSDECDQSPVRRPAPARSTSALNGWHSSRNRTSSASPPSLRRPNSQTGIDPSIDAWRRGFWKFQPASTRLISA